MATMPFDLLGVYFGKTFVSGSFVQFSTIPRQNTGISPKYSLRARGNADETVNVFKLKFTTSSNTTAAADTERDVNVIGRISTNATKFDEQTRYQSFQDAETHEEYQLWPTPSIFRPADDTTRFLAFLDGQGGTSNRRYLGAYYELCVYHAFKAYFNGRAQEITPLDLLVAHDMLMKRGTNFAQVIRTIGTRFLQSVDKGLVRQDSGQLKTHFRLEYQKRFDKGDTTKYIDFLFTPTLTIKKLELTGRFHGIGEVAWEYSYDAEIIAEMKSEAGLAKKLSAAGRAAIKQNADYSNFAVPVFFGLLKVESDPGTGSVGEYGVISTLTEPSANATTVYWELEVDSKDSTSYFPRHLVNSTPRMRFTDNTNIWYYGNKQFTGVFLAKPGFFLPFTITKEFIWVINPFRLRPNNFFKGIAEKLPNEDRKYQYACLYNGGRAGLSEANFLFLQLNFDAKEDAGEPVCVLFYVNDDGKYNEYNWPELTERFTKGIEANWKTFDNRNERDDYKFTDFWERLFGEKPVLMNLFPSVPDGQVGRTEKFEKTQYVDNVDGWKKQPKMKSATYTRIDGNPSEMYCENRNDARVDLKIKGGRELKLPKKIRLKLERNSSCLVRCEVKRSETVKDPEDADDSADNT